MFYNKINNSFLLVLIFQLIFVAASANGDFHKHEETNPDSLFSRGNVFEADITYGWIGASEESTIDAPHDNIFKIDVSQTIPMDASIWLEYDLYGVSNPHSVALIVNDNTAVGGYLVHKNQEWTTHREELNRSWVAEGLNRIQFSKLAALDYNYQVKNLRLVVETAESTTEDIVVQSTFTADGKKAYLRGFIRNENSGIKQIALNDRAIAIRDNSFEILFNNENALIENYQLKVSYADGSEKVIVLDALIAKENNIVAETIEAIATHRFDIPANAEHQINLENFGFEIEDNVLSTALSLRYTQLRHVDLPPMDSYMTNVTKTSAGYRLLPHGQHFTDEGATLRMAYDNASIPRGHTAADIRTFYFDIASSEWKQLQRDSIDIKNGFIYSKVTHFTDYINGVLAAPESPTTSNFASTDFEDLIKGNPMAGINLISPPTASQTGQASMSYPLELPAGRNGMQPNLALTYSSDAGSSWAGYGWNLQVPSITIETRWGSPRYDAAMESEAYLLAGEQLVMQDPNPNTDPSYLPHRNDWIARSTGTTEFYKRVQGPSGFEEVIRHGDNPSTYYWTVTDRNGITYHYGGVGQRDANFLVSTDLANQAQGNVAKWLLARSEDSYGNFIDYTYGKSFPDIDPDPNNVLTAVSCYLTSISYTHHNSSPGIYNVIFNSMDERIDSRLDGRSRVLMLDDRELKTIEVQESGTTFRVFRLEKTPGEFQKSLLIRLALEDNNNNVLYDHTFNHFNDLSEAGSSYSVEPDWTVGAFEPNDFDENDAEYVFGSGINNLGSLLNSNGIPADILNSEIKFSPLGGSQSEAFGASLYLGLGVGIRKDKSLTAGVSYGFQISNSTGMVEFLDIDGDGLPDKVYKNGDNSLRYRANSSRSEDPNNLFQQFDPITPALSRVYGGSAGLNGTAGVDFSSSRDVSHNLDKKAHLGIPPLNFILGGGESKNRTSINSYFSDINGDGFVDIVDNGTVQFNTSNPNSNNLGFSNDLGSLFCPLRPVLPFSLSIFETTENDEYQIQNPPLDVVRVWRAPRDGFISIAQSNATIDAGSVDGVILQIQLEDNVLETSNNGMLSTTSITMGGINNIFIEKGQRIFFRASSVQDITGNGENDIVNWNTEVTYDVNSTNLDVYGRDNDNFRFTNDMLATSNVSFVSDEAGQLVFEASFNYTAINDEIDLEVWKINTTTGLEKLVTSYPIGSGSGTNTITHTQNTTVEETMQFRVSSNSNVNWSNIITLAASITINGNLKADYQNEDNLIVPIIHAYYQETDFSGSLPFADTRKPIDPSLINIPFTVTANVLDVTATLPAYAISIKDDTNVYYQEAFDPITGLTVVVNPTPIGPGANIYCTITSNDISIENHVLPNGMIKLVGSGAAQKLKPSLHVYNSEERLNFNAQYRGWGVFAYNPAAPGAGYASIPAMTIEDSPIDPATTDPSDPSSITMSGEEIVLWPMTLAWDGTSEYWVAADKSSYINTTFMKPSRLGDDNVDAMITTSGSYPALPIVSTGETNSEYWPISVLGLSVTRNSSGSTASKLDYKDLNGDRIPDIILTDQIYYSFHDGVLDSPVTNAIGTNSTSHRMGIVDLPVLGNVRGSISINGTLVHSKENTGSNSKGANNGNKESAQSGGVSITGSLAASANESKSDNLWIDVNGDGLPDMVSSVTVLDASGSVASVTVNVNYNTGYEFSQPVAINITREINSNFSSTESVGLGLSLAQGSFNIGAGYTKTITKGQSSFIDLNGDGLLDFVFMNNQGNLNYLLNTGYDFVTNNQVFDLGGLDNPDPLGHISSSRANGSSINGAFTIPIPLGPAATIIINPNITASKSISRTEATFQDIDGDGFVDLLESGETGYFQPYDNSMVAVRRSNIGRTNRIETVVNSIGGLFNMNYAMTSASVRHPGGKLVLSSLVVNDGTEDNGPAMNYKFDYAKGFYDRCERTFLGFKNVNIREGVFDANGDFETYRTTANIFENTDVYRKGLLMQSMILANDVDDTTGAPTVATWKTSNYSYESYVVTPDVGQNNNHSRGSVSTIWDINPSTSAIWSNSDIVFTGVSTTQTQLNINGNIGDNVTIQYDDRGNVMQYDYNNGSAPYSVTLQYDNTQNRINDNLLSLGTRLEIPQRRLRQAIYNNQGDILASYVTFGGGLVAQTDYSYDAFGNMATVLLPVSGQANQRQNLQFAYEQVANTYVTTVNDLSFGYTSTMTNFDYRFGVPEISTDINGNAFQYNYDDFGRLDDFLFVPADMASFAANYNFGADLNYDLSAFPISATTLRDDPEVANNILTSVNFSDGLGRMLQSVAVAEVNGTTSSIYAGVPTYDAFGRLVERAYPSDGGGLFAYSAQGGLVTTNSYDLLDRKIGTIHPGGRLEQFIYANDGPSLRTTYRDPNGNFSITKSEYNGPVVEKTSNLGFVTSFQYDEIDQLEVVTHPNPGQTTVYTYDQAGNVRTVVSPDKPLTTFTYDARSNVLTKVDNWTATYNYEFGRLIGIDFSYQNMNIEYEYDDPNASNGQGRLTRMTDITGSQDYNYDPLGEVTQIDRSIALPYKSDGLDFTTEWEYDIWGRLQTMTYPDGEELDYAYDLAGTLNAVSGVKSGNAYNYVQAINYDEFGARTELQYGNGHTMDYVYSLNERWLNQANMAFSNGDFTVNYSSYDMVGNIEDLTYVTSTTPSDLFGNGTQSYNYDNDYRLLSGAGVFNGALFCEDQTNKFSYTHTYQYDDMGNIEMKNSESFRRDATYSFGYNQEYELDYSYQGNTNRIQNITETFEDDDTYNSVVRDASHTFAYDNNGNTTAQNQSIQDEQNGNQEINYEHNRNLIWGEQDILRASADNNAITHYFYDGNNERVLKMSDSHNKIFVNSELSEDTTFSNLNYTIYPNAFLVLRPDGHYTKHYFIGSERIASKIGNPEDYDLTGTNANQRTAMQIYIEDNMTQLFPQKVDIEKVFEDESATFDVGLSDDNDDEELQRYFFSSDHVSSATMISNNTGELVQNLQYAPFGETFVDMRSENFATNYRFTGQEQDAETGLYYYGARYYDSRLARFMSVDPLANKYLEWSPYNYTFNNPIKYNDPTGMGPDCDDCPDPIIRAVGDIVNSPETSLILDAITAFSDNLNVRVEGRIGLKVGNGGQSVGGSLLEAGVSWNGERGPAVDAELLTASTNNSVPGVGGVKTGFTTADVEYYFVGDTDNWEIDALQGSVKVYSHGVQKDIVSGKTSVSKSMKGDGLHMGPVSASGSFDFKQWVEDTASGINRYIEKKLAPIKRQMQLTMGMKQTGT